MSADSTRFTVRRGVPADLDAALDVRRRSSGRPVSARAQHDTAAAMDDPTRLFIVAETDARMIGWAKTKHFAEPDGLAPAGHYLMGILVDPECRRAGVGTELVRERLEWIAQRTDRAFFFTNVGNAASIALHRRWGFREIARGRGFRGVPFDGGVGILFSAELPPARSS
ncbi:hypothetical protein GCM10027568_03600 [Humibacter soli]